ncbi:MAG: hypothetical protein VYA34_05195 [Myxococcota bacterium]|nr:hypothetical protein [Myxococcota bacterium]
MKSKSDKIQSSSEGTTEGMVQRVLMDKKRLALLVAMDGLPPVLTRKLNRNSDSRRLGKIYG